MLKLKGSMPLSFFTLEIEVEFKNIGEIDVFLDWIERVRRFHAPRRDRK